MVAAAESVAAPVIADGSACTVTVQLPAAMPVTLNADPDDCQPGGAALQVASAVATLIGIDAGVPGGTAFAFVSVACAVNEPVAPMPIVAGAPVIVT